ncbi:7855_t:CDS:1, partial [Cetraspora pellucida]
LEISLSVSGRLEIVAPQLLPATKISQLLYVIYDKLNYLFGYLDYQVVTQEKAVVDKTDFKEYFSFLCDAPFL